MDLPSAEDRVASFLASLFAPQPSSLSFMDIFAALTRHSLATKKPATYPFSKSLGSIMQGSPSLTYILCCRIPLLPTLIRRKGDEEEDLGVARDSFLERVEEEVGGEGGPLKRHLLIAAKLRENKTTHLYSAETPSVNVRRAPLSSPRPCFPFAGRRRQASVRSGRSVGRGGEEKADRTRIFLRLLPS